ncbi:zincin-like metallopeptidase domain-containing protein [Bulleidia sp. zg-1006]|uniref:zincin-like metallopeptidase domain-containing protein n=1 Tax=Bulleidia sp. zg-1006 TaxID=2806552 RepID=UPI001939327F|nr:zincin-like metallopeptidase domain-containing protein [Bulleidia sp. zg-1006]QRG86928.1 DUF1738 domain-containing protein [Bulleidia sp. zg-1006]
MEKKKYELTSDYKIDFETKVYRIKALTSFGDVKAGDLGGYIQNERNLSQTGNAWVKDNAVVKGKARVTGNAWVKDNAVVKDNAKVRDNALVTDNAVVKDNAKVRDNALVTDNAVVRDNAVVEGNAWVYGNAVVKDYAVVQEFGRVEGHDVVDGDFVVAGLTWKNSKDEKSLKLNDSLEAPKEEYSQKGSRKDEFRKGLAKQFLKLLDSENVEKSFSWIKGWRMNGGQQNLNSGKHYRGINRLVLALKAYEKGYSDPRWITFNGLKDYEGAYIKKGEHGTKVEYWAAVKDEPIYDPVTKKEKKFFTISEMSQYIVTLPLGGDDFKIFPKYATVFNAEQCVGLPEYVKQVTNSEVTQSELVTKISESMGVKIVHHKGSDKCYYSPLEDVIHLPQQTDFKDDYAYNATALHELAHSTGATNRLDRNLQNYFGTVDYAFEELVAEMTGALVSTSLPGTEEDLDSYLKKHSENHKAYIASWIDHIQKDVDVLPRALKLAELSADFLELHGGLMSLEEYNKRHQYEKPVIADETTGKLFIAKKEYAHDELIDEFNECLEVAVSQPKGDWAETENALIKEGYSLLNHKDSRGELETHYGVKTLEKMENLIYEAMENHDIQLGTVDRVNEQLTNKVIQTKGFQIETE